MITRDLSAFFLIVPKNKSLIAIDYGTKKTGIAISDPQHKIALPLCTILENDCAEQVLKIKNLIVQKKIGGIIVGLPLTQNNCKVAITEKTELLASKLLTSNNPVLLYDERFSSKAARNLFKIHGIKESKIRETNDQVAASLMLEEILESQR
jgi:putative Holliday junction resolvase